MSLCRNSGRGGRRACAGEVPRRGPPRVWGRPRTGDLRVRLFRLEGARAGPGGAGRLGSRLGTKPRARRAGSKPVQPLPGRQERRSRPRRPGALRPRRLFRSRGQRGTTRNSGSVSTPKRGGSACHKTRCPAPPGCDLGDRREGAPSRLGPSGKGVPGSGRGATARESLAGVAGPAPRRSQEGVPAAGLLARPGRHRVERAGLAPGGQGRGKHRPCPPAPSRRTSRAVYAAQDVHQLETTAVIY